MTCIVATDFDLNGCFRTSTPRGPAGRIFPEIEPVGSTRHDPRIRFSRSSASDEPTCFAERHESRDVIARLTVYALNLTIMLFAFPVGFAILIFNILGGENLRTTAHAMALTGMAVALVNGGMIAPLV